MTEPDVVVIGGGPAGLAAAIVCARLGLAVTLIERHAFPVDKPCGEGLLPNAVEVLGRIGIDPEHVAMRGTAIDGIRYISAKGRTAKAAFPPHTAIGMRRADLSELLVSHARSLPSLEIMSEGKASVELGDGGRPFVLACDRTLRPKLVIGADGLHSQTRDSVRIAVRRSAGQRWGCRQHFDMAAWTGHVEVYFGNGFEVYVTPVPRGVNVAVLWDASVLRVGGVCSPVMTLVARVPSLAQRLKGCTPTDRPRARGPFGVSVPRPWASGVLLIGDSAGYLDALTGEGVGLALEQATLLAESVIPALQGTSPGSVIDAAALAQFARAARVRSRSYRLITHLLLGIARYPAVVEGLVGTLALHPSTFTRLLEFHLCPRARVRGPLNGREKAS